MKLFIVCLRRSGSTVVWKQFRQDKRLRCYDEPFVDLHINLPKVNRKKTNYEFIEMVKKDPVTFWNMYCPINHSQEISEDMLEAQKQYLAFLMNSAEHVVCDLTRCCFKIKTLKNICPDAYLIHLHRSPQAFASSNILPNTLVAIDVQSVAITIRKHLNKLHFWSLKHGNDVWGYERITGDSDDGLFSTYLKENGLFIEKFNSLPAYGKLMYFWKVCYDKVESDGQSHFGSKFLSIAFEEFCTAPVKSLQEIYKTIKMPLPEINVNAIRQANLGFKPYHPRWEEMAERLGFMLLAEHPWLQKRMEGKKPAEL